MSSSSAAEAAIFRSRIPIVSAVGHEIDVTIADLVADFRAATPSEAAERVVPDVSELRQGLIAADAHLRNLLARRLDAARSRLDELSRRRVFRFPFERLRDAEQRLDVWFERLQRGVGQRVSRERDNLSLQSARLDALSPLNVLGRGYTLTRKYDSREVIRRIDQVRPGDRIRTRLQLGEFTSVVGSIDGVTPAEPATP
jgi:exodeoxyribonuclease VII large subunit